MPRGFICIEDTDKPTIEPFISNLGVAVEWMDCGGCWKVICPRQEDEAAVRVVLANHRIDEVTGCCD